MTHHLRILPANDSPPEQPCLVPKGFLKFLGEVLRGSHLSRRLSHLLCNLLNSCQVEEICRSMSQRAVSHTVHSLQMTKQHFQNSNHPGLRNVLLLQHSNTPTENDIRKSEILVRTSNKDFIVLLSGIPPLCSDFGVGATES